MVDNHIYWGNALGLDQRRIAWRRVLDMNDRALREVVVGLGGPSNGFTREDGFDITVASEVMAAFCLASDIDDLEGRLGRMVVGYTYGKAPVTTAELKAEGAMSALLKEAIKPNLVRRSRARPRWCTAARSPTSRTAATPSWRPKPRSSSPTMS